VTVCSHFYAKSRKFEKRIRRTTPPR
jgi:hypothetical protein